MDCDVAVVGGGIAGSALASVLAREGLEVVVLERQQRYADRVRGELLVPWGVAEAQRLGLYDALVGGGARLSEDFVDYADGDDPAEAEANAIPLAQLVDGAAGALNLSHPAACAALAAEAAAHGASVLRGVSHVEATPGARPVVSYRLDGDAGEVACRLVVGADGRSSRVRRQVGIRLERAPETHLIAGLLVEGLDIPETRNIAGVGDGVYMLAFPQGAGRAGVYLCPGLQDPQRFAGPDGAARFVRASAVRSVPGAETWGDAVPVGPCRTYPGDDSWTDRPFADGVVLIGDAGGHNDPLIGQGWPWPCGTIFTGPDDMDPETCTDAFRRRFLGLDR